jgi:hypothetical protein
MTDQRPLDPADDTGSSVHEHNRRAWDARVRKRQRFTLPAADEEIRDPLKVVDGVGWLGKDLRGRKLLCLAAGGGRHSALYAAAACCCSTARLRPRDA